MAINKDAAQFEALSDAFPWCLQVRCSARDSGIRTSTVCWAVRLYGRCGARCIPRFAL